MTSPIENPPIAEAEILWPFTSAEGVGVTSLGEDGEDWIVQGHLAPEVAFALLWQCAAHLYDEATADHLFGDGGSYDAETLKPAFGVFTPHAHWCELVTGDVDDEEDGPCCTCDEFGWFVTWGEVDADTPGAVPIMVLEL